MPRTGIPERAAAMPELKNTRVWYDPNTGRLQVTVQAENSHSYGDLPLKHVTLRVEYGHGSSTEHSIRAYPRRRDGED